MTEVTNHLDDTALRKVDAIQVENPWMFDYVCSIRERRELDLRYAPPGVNTSLFCPLPRRDFAADLYILCVGRLNDPRKNIGLLLEAYALLSSSVRATTRLVLAGSCAPGDEFWMRAESLGLRDRITFVAKPSREELVRIYQRASVFVLPSDEEGLGVVLLEAMACGVPVISTKSGGPEGIVSDEVDGYLVPLDDAAALASRIDQLLCDTSRRTSMGIQARRTIERRFSEDVAGEVFVDMWERMAGQHGRMGR